MLTAGVIGLGYWGPNLVRNLVANPGIHLVAACDSKPKRCRVIADQYPGVEVLTDASKIIHDPAIDVVAIATPTQTHYALTKLALEAGKHVLVEKPMTDSVAHAEELVNLARARGLVLMVDHTYVYHPAVERIHETIHSGELGDIFYYDSVRINLGLFQPDTSVLWDLGSHDASIMDYVLPQRALSVQATGARHAGARVESMVYLTVRFEDGVLGHCHANWLAPTKVRQVMIGGSRKMIIYDDNNVPEKLKIFDKSVELETDERIYEAKVRYRVGDMVAPALSNDEALGLEIEHLRCCLELGTTPRTDGEAALRVVRMLAAAEESLRKDGASIAI